MLWELPGSRTPIVYRCVGVWALVDLRTPMTHWCCVACPILGVLHMGALGHDMCVRVEMGLGTS